MAPLPDALKLLGLHHTAEHLDDLVALGPMTADHDEDFGRGALRVASAARRR